MGFDFQHGFMVIDLLAAIETFVEFHHRDDIGLSLELARKVAGHTLDFVTATGGTGFDFQGHGFWDYLRSNRHDSHFTFQTIA